jgi:hypothetical protein
VPPARLSERATELAAIQRGNEVILSWPSPALVGDKSSRSYIARVDIYRLDEIRAEEPVLDPDEYEESAQVIGYLDRAAIEAQIKSLGRLQYKDVLNLGQATQLAGTRLRYAVRYVNRRDQAAAFSVTVSVEPAAAVALPPTALRASAPAQDEVLIEWRPPESNVDGARPATIVGYNVYRRVEDGKPAGELLNPEPVSDTSFTDKSFEYEEEYAYIVRALSQGANGLIESADSEPLKFEPVDSFAPAAPESVSIASANITISLFWPSSPEPDVIGYNIYRAESASAADGDWPKLNPQPIATTTFHDDKVVTDKKYYYRITAIDRFKNESAPSRVVSETAHP